MQTQGLPGEFLFLFTLLIWCLFIMTFVANPHNKLNRWCFMSGMLFSLGVFKEYLFFTLNPFLIERYPAIMSQELSLHMYSIMTAILYYLSMPCMLIFSFYFFGLDHKNPRLFNVLRFVVFIPAVIYAIVYPYINTRDYQLYDSFYYITVAIYNWIYGIIGTAFIVTPLIRERLTFQYHQKKMVSVVVLMPIWYWLISAFPFHIFKPPHYAKLWQGNILIILFLIIYYVRNMFKDGIWGTRLTRETYDWFGSAKIIQKNSQYLSHTLKNELSKISWCTDILRSSTDGHQEELDIIDHSISHLKQFISRTKLYSDEIILKPENVDVQQLFRSCAEDNPGLMSRKDITVVYDADPAPLLCDYEHLREVLGNLISNAADAIEEQGTICLVYQRFPKKHAAVIEVSDTGHGMADDVLTHVFDPYFTKKSSYQHLGLGLYYCYNVMDRHHGCIKVRSTPGEGTVFSLYFPYRPDTKEHRPWKKS